MRKPGSMPRIRIFLPADKGGSKNLKFPPHSSFPGLNKPRLANEAQAEKQTHAMITVMRVMRRQTSNRETDVPEFGFFGKNRAYSPIIAVV
jgi:hypothetical protein